MSKIAIIASGGGMICSYSVGSMLGLAEIYNLKDPDLIIGSSGSTGTLAYFVARQYSSFRIVWEDLLTTKKFVSFARINRIMDIDYMIDEVFKKQEPLDATAIRNSKTEYLLAITDAEAGQSNYVSNHSDVDIFEAIRASCAIPVIFNKQVNIEGKKYIDGGISAQFYNNIHKAKLMGAEKIIAIDTANSGGDWSLDWKLYFLFKNKIFRKNAIASHELEKKYKKQYSQDPNVFIIRPSQKVPAGRLDIDKAHIQDSINLGYDDIVNNKELEEFLK